MPAAAADLVCLAWLEQRRCVRHAELSCGRGIDAVVVPIPAGQQQDEQVQQHAAAVAAALQQAGLCTQLDTRRGVRPGAKRHHWERVGVPLRLDVGPAELAAGCATVCVNPGLAAQVSAAATDCDCRSQSSSGGGSSGSSNGGTAAAARAALLQLLQQHGCNATAGEPVIASAAAAAAGAAVHTAGIRPWKLAGVPLAAVPDVCLQLLAGVAAVVGAGERTQPAQPQPGAAAVSAGRTGTPQLLPWGCCARLHLWPSQPAARRPCAQHVQHLLAAGLPCHCDAAPHVELPALQAELQVQMQRAGMQQKLADGLLQTAAGAKGSGQSLAQQQQQQQQQDGGSRSGGVGLFLTGLPQHWPAAAAWQAIVAAAQSRLPDAAAPHLGEQAQPGSSSCGADSTDTTAPARRFSVMVASSGSRGARRCRGWARLTLPDLATARWLMQELGGQLELVLPPPPSNGDGPADGADSSSSTGRRVVADVSWCSGRADALFPHLRYCCRRALRLDSVAAYSTTDSATGLSISRLLADLAAAVKQQQQDQQQQHDEPALSAVDLTACAGGSAAALLHHFAAVTALELDPDRADDLLHNIRVLLGQQHACSGPLSAHPSSSSWQLSTTPQQLEAGAQQAAAATNGAAGPVMAFDHRSVPHLAVLQRPQQPPPQQQASQLVRAQRVAVVCGDAVGLLPQLRRQDVVFVDPPWGGPSYMQLEQEQGGEEAAGRGCAAAQMVLGSMSLLELCRTLMARCGVLGVRLPSRCTDLQAFVSGALQGGGPGGIAAGVRYGRSMLVLFVQPAAAAAAGNEGCPDAQHAAVVCDAVRCRLRQAGAAWTCVL